MTDPTVLERRDRPLVFVDDIERPVLDDGDYQHLSRSLRHRTGDAISVSDGRGRWRTAAFGVEPEVTGEIRTEASPHPELTVGFTPVKAAKPESIIHHLVELGIDRIMVLSARRSVVRWSADRAEAQWVRWQRVAREAAMQSRSVWLPRVERLTTLAAATSDVNLAPCLAEPGGAEVDASVRTILVGPEGGWDPAEVADQSTVALPGRILRAETAAVAAGALLVDRHRRQYDPVGGIAG